MNPLIGAASEISDIEIISQVLSGQTAQYELIVKRYNSYVYKIGRAYGFNHEDVQDLMQDSYVKAFINLEKFENRSSFLTWLSRIMLNNCYHKKRKSGYKNEKSTDTIEEKSTPMFSNEINSKKILNDELKNILESAIVEIPEKYRIVFTLREINGMSVKETADVLEMTESNVKMRLHRAKTFLQNELIKSYSPEEIFEFNLIYCDAMVERVMDAIHTIQEKK